MKSVFVKGVVPFCATLFFLLLTGCLGVGNGHDDLKVKIDHELLETRDYRIRPLDMIRWEMFAEPDNRGEQRVTGDGNLGLPLLGQVKVAGLTLSEAKSMIELAYRNSGYYVNPQISLNIVAYAERRIYVTGFVGRSGPIVMPTEESMTIISAIAAAGGLQPRASNVVVLTRIIDGVAKPYEINIRDIQEGIAPDVPLLEGDRIYARDSKI